MINSNDAIKDLHHQLCGTKGSYDELCQKVENTDLGSTLNTILARREDNIAELEQFLADEGVDLIDPPADAMVTSATPDAVLAAEKQILEAYDKAIAPITGSHEKYDFLNDQYEWLNQIVSEMADNTDGKSPF